MAELLEVTVSLEEAVAPLECVWEGLGVPVGVLELLGVPVARGVVVVLLERVSEELGELVCVDEELRVEEVVDEGVPDCVLVCEDDRVEDGVPLCVDVGEDDGV